jgi:hypothetical protein
VHTANGRDGLRAGVLCGATALIATLVVIYATPNDAYWIVDCGAKALLAERLVETRFTSLDLGYPAAAFDPDGEAFPIPPPFAVPRGDDFVSHYPPAYPAVAAPFLAALGPAGLRLPAALAAAACAFLFAIWTAPAFGRRWAAAGGLTLALATPLFFYGVTVWEHSLTVALPLFAVVLLTRRTAARLLLAGFLVGAACWFREELVLALAALAFACFACDRAPRAAALVSAGAAPALAGLALFNTAAYGHPLGVHVAYNVHALPPLADSIRDLGALVAGLGATPAEGTALAAGAVASLLLGLFVARNDRALPACVAAASLFGLAAWLRGSLAILGAEIPFVELVRFNGFAVQMPLVCLAGIGAERVRRLADLAPLRLGVVTGAGFLALAMLFRVTLSDFSSGGHWGPRMLLPAAPALLALTIAAVQPAASSGARGRGLVLAAWVALVAAGLLSSALATKLLVAQKLEARELERRIASAPQNVVVTTHPALGQQLAGLWGDKPMLLAQSPADLNRIAADLNRSGVEEFLLVRRRGPGGAPGARCALVGRHRGRFVERLFDVDLLRCIPIAPASSAPHSEPIRE